MSKIKRYVPFVAAVILGGVLVKVASKKVPKMMGKVMPKMMGGMMSEGGPMNMCRQMMEGFVEARKLGTYATPEVRTLFEDWAKGMEQAALDFVKEATTTNPEEVAHHLKLSKESAIFFLSKLAREGKIKIDAVSAA